MKKKICLLSSFLLFCFSMFGFTMGIDCSFYDEQIANLQKQIDALKASAEGEKVGIARNLGDSGLSSSAIANSTAGVDKKYQSQITSIEGTILSLQQQKLNCMSTALTSSYTSVSSTNCNAFNGASLYADDGTFLGILNDNRFDSKSIANSFGDYGSSFSSKSIFNSFGKYGSRFNSMSPWNKFSSKGPIIKKNGKTIGILTLNNFTNGAQNPFDVLSCFVKRSDDRREKFEDLYETWHGGTTSVGGYGSYYDLTTTYDKDYSNTSCQLQYGSNSIVDPTDSDYCICKNGYTWNSAGTSCITKDQSCKNKYGTNSYLGSDDLCYCKDGYTWNSVGTSCITDDQSCKSKYGTNSIVDPTDSDYCICKDGYGWDTPDKTTCVSIDKSCKGWYGSNSYAGTDDLCYCKDGYEWNESMTSCIKKSITTNMQKNNGVLSTLFTNAYNFAYSKGITTMDSIDKADMSGTLDRIAMAKMIGNYAINVLGIQPDTNQSCYFSDVSNVLNTQYDNGVTKACQLGLMGQGIAKFMPFNKVTRAEFATILSRLLNRNSDDLSKLNSANPYYSEHMKYLRDNGIIDDYVYLGDFNNELRGYVMLMLYRADTDSSDGGGCAVEDLLSCLELDDDEVEACFAACNG